MTQKWYRVLATQWLLGSTNSLEIRKGTPELFVAARSDFSALARQ